MIKSKATAGKKTQEVVRDDADGHVDARHLQNMLNLIIGVAAALMECNAICIH